MGRHCKNMPIGCCVIQVSLLFKVPLIFCNHFFKFGKCMNFLSVSYYWCFSFSIVYDPCIVVVDIFRVVLYTFTFVLYLSLTVVKLYFACCLLHSEVVSSVKIVFV